MALYAIRRHKAAVNAWCWVVSFRRRGQLHDKRFYDLSLGGSAAAKAAAIAWRDAQLEEIETLSMREFHAQVRSNNTSGVPGVHFNEQPRSKLRGIKEPSKNSSRGKPRGIEPYRD